MYTECGRAERIEFLKDHTCLARDYQSHRWKFCGSLSLYQIWSLDTAVMFFLK